MLEDNEIPEPVADDAPDPDQFEAGETVNTTMRNLCAVDYDGARYCMDCANPEYVDLARSEPRRIPYGGPVPTGSEVDCPGHACDHCHRRIGDMVILHYGDVCDPFSCPDMTAEVAVREGGDETVEVALLEHDGGRLRVMFREPCGETHDRGDHAALPESRLR